MSDKPAKSYHIHGLILLAAILLGVGAYFAFISKAHSPATEIIPAAGAEEIAATAEQPAAAAPVEALDIPALLKERTLGDVNAPIKIAEHSSLTCPHCAHFHKETYKKLKEAYIDTGKAYLVFSDFPLNGLAMHASQAARCVPELRYFDFIQMLYEHQDDWAYKTDYLTYLKDRALEYGITEARFKACIQSEELQKGILDNMRKTQTKFGVTSTPSFVVNDKDKMSGAFSLEDFVKAMNMIVEGKKPETPAPAKTE